MLARVSCIPAAAEYTANIQNPRSQPHTEKNNPLLPHVAQIERHAISQALSTILLLVRKIQGEDRKMWSKVAAVLRAGLIMPVARMWL